MNKFNLSPNEYLGTSEVARILKLSISTVHNLVKSGKLQAWTTEGGHRRISNGSLNDYRNQVQQNGKSTLNIIARVGVLLSLDNQKKLNASSNLKSNQIKYYNFSSMFDIVSGYEKIKPNLLLLDYYSIHKDVDLEMFKMMNNNALFNKFFAIIFIPQNLEDLKIHELSRFKNILLLPASENLSWLNGFICGLGVASRIIASTLDQQMRMESESLSYGSSRGFAHERRAS